jgi:putative DNA primase/helicase
MDNAEWAKTGMAAKDAGITFEVFDDWCASDPDGYPGTVALRSRWNSWKQGKVTAGTLIHMARATGWEPDTQNRLSDEQAEAQRQERTKKAEQARLKQQQQHQEAATLADKILTGVDPADPMHPYLTRKGVDGEGLYQMPVADLAALLDYCPKSGGERLAGMILIAPVQQSDGTISTLELIDEQGHKTALAGGKKAGGYWLSGQLPDDDGEGSTIAIAEGIATAKSVHQAIGGPVLAALSCHNLHHIAEAMKQRYPAARLLVCGDLGNGQQDAETAAASVGASLVLPAFPDGSNEGMSDFNDLASAAGIGVVRQQIEEAISRKSTGITPILDTSSKKDDDNGIDSGAANEAVSESFSLGTDFSRDNRDTGINPALARLLKHPGEKTPNRDNRDTGIEQAEICEKWYIPAGFRLLKDGVYREFEHKEELKTERVCNPLVILGLTKGIDGEGYGFLLSCQATSGELRHPAMLAAELHAEASTLAGKMENIGVAVEPMQAKHLSIYLGKARRLAENRPFITSSPRLGWLPGEQLAYMLPNCVIGATGYVYHPRQRSLTAEAVRESGTLAEWRARVAAPAMRDPITTVAMLGALAGAVIQPGRMDTFGLHFFGVSSRGKTTALQVGSSVWGDGADPNASAKGLCKKWNGTANNLEALAEESTGLVLCLDELGSFKDDKALSRSIYNLCSGQGAGRLNANAERKQQREWQAFILSAGEVSIKDEIEKSGSKQKAGTAIRVLDIPYPESGLFAGVADAGALVDQLRQACTECFGTAGPAFVAFLVESFQTRQHLYQHLEDLKTRYADDLDSGGAPEIKRAAKRLAFLRVVGELAQQADVLPGTAKQVAEACRGVWDMWRGHVPVVDDTVLTIASVRDYIQSNPGRFIPTNTPEQDRAFAVSGYTKDGMHIFTESGFKLATGGASTSAAAAALKRAGLLFMNGKDRLKSKHVIKPGGRQEAGFYAVYDKIFEYETGEKAESIPVLSRSGVLSRSENSCQTVVGCSESRTGTDSIPFIPVIPQKNNTEGNETVAGEVF